MDHIQCDDIKKMMAVFPEYVKRLEKVEEKQEDQGKIINELVSSHAETKVYVKIILEKIDGIEGNLFKHIRQAMQDAAHERVEEKKLEYAERKDQSHERVKTTTGWQGLIKYVIGATIGALIAGIVAYLKIIGG